jgi:hypothetical protein
VFEALAFFAMLCWKLEGVAAAKEVASAARVKCASLVARSLKDTRGCKCTYFLSWSAPAPFPHPSLLGFALRNQNRKDNSTTALKMYLN